MIDVPLFCVRRLLLLFSHYLVSDSLWPPWAAARQVSFTISRSLLELMANELVMPFNHLILRHSLLLMPSILPSIRIFSNKSALCIMWPKYWSFSFMTSVLPMNTQGWFPLRLTGLTSSLFKGLSYPAPQLESINSSALSLFYSSTLTSIMTIGKTTALAIRNSVKRFRR